jgi:aminoglycoside phosphotransferase (APT) family kinase protein
MASLHEVRFATAAIRDASSPVGTETLDSGVRQANVLTELTQESCAALDARTIVYDPPVPPEETPALLHDGEFEIDDELVGDLIASQMPGWSELRLRRLDTAGTVNVIYRLGDDKLVRLPRHVDFSNSPLRESHWLPRFAPAVPLQIPTHLALGTPTNDYPSPWSVLGWIEGENATQASLSDLNRAANRLGEFVLAMRAIGTIGAPNDHYRGKGLGAVDADARRYITMFPDDIDQAEVLDVWESCVAAPDWDGPPTWFHSDLHSGNLLARDGELVAVLDFEGCSIGDPASDLMAAWWLFDQTSRDTFLGTIAPDEASLIRGKGWALYMCIAGIPYYLDTNPGFVVMARRALTQIANT